MTENLVSQASKYLTPELKDKIAGALGTDRKHVGQASNAAIPALLGGLASLASDREGVQRLDAALAQHSPDVLDNISASITGERRKDFVDKGMRSLSTLFGSSSVPAMGNAVARFSGLGQSKGSSLLAMLAPMVLGLLGQKKAERGLDTSGLAHLLAEQKDNITAALPLEFKRMLGSGNMPEIAGVERPAAPPAERTAAERANRKRRTASGGRWIWALLIIAVLGAAIWYFSGTTPQTPVRKQTVIGGVELTSTMKRTLGDVTTALDQINDVISARAALPELETAEAELDGILDLARQLPPEGRNALASAASQARPEFARAARRALSVQDVEPVIQSYIQEIRIKLDRLANL